MELFLVFSGFLVVFDVYVELVEGDLDAIVIELALNLFKNVEVNGPIISSVYPYLCGDVNGAGVMCGHTDCGRLILEGKLVLGKDLIDDSLGLFEVVVVADREGKVNTAKIVFGVVDDIAVCKLAVRDVDNLIVGSEYPCVGETDILDCAGIALCLDVVINLEGSGDYDEKAACDIGYCAVNGKT